MLPGFQTCAIKEYQMLVQRVCDVLKQEMGIDISTITLQDNISNQAYSFGLRQNMHAFKRTMHDC
jgi:hypothetical protein